MIALLAASGATDTRGQVLSDLTQEQIRQALSDNDAETCYPLAVRDRSLGFSLGTLKARFACFTTPYSRVAVVGAAARKKYKNPSEADVTPDVISRDELHIHAFAHSSDGPGMANVEAIVILPRGSKDRSLAIQPTRLIETSAEYKNLMGASFEGKSLTAVFPLSVLTENNEVHIVFDRILPHPFSCVDCTAVVKLKKVK